MVGDSSIAAEYGWTNSQKVRNQRVSTVCSYVTPIHSVHSTLYAPVFDSHVTATSAQGMIISGFFYGYSIPQLAGGWAAARYGGRAVFFAMGIATLMNTLTPAFASHGVYAALMGRVVVGLAQAPMWPTFIACVSRWLLPAERSKLYAWAHASNSISFFVGNTFTPVLMEGFGWRGMFYIYGAISLCWVPMWHYMGWSRPEDHPRIHPAEKALILRKQAEAGVGESSDRSAALLRWLLRARQTHICIASLLHSILHLSRVCAWLRFGGEQARSPNSRTPRHHGSFS